MSEGENAQGRSGEEGLRNGEEGLRAYHRIFQYFHSKRVHDDSSEWIHMAVNGKWPVNTSQITAGETAEILSLILAEFTNTPRSNARSTANFIRRYTHPDKGTW